VHHVEDWSEVHRLFDRERLSKAAIARRLGMSRNTVARLLELDEPPRYVRTPKGSQLGPFTEAIAAMLDAGPKAPATAFSAWAEIFGDPVAVVAMVDRLVHHAEVIVLKATATACRARERRCSRDPNRAEPLRFRPAFPAQVWTGVDMH
jgi:hypothetical protein